MKINEVMSRPDILKKNYENLLASIPPSEHPEEALITCIMSMPTTHTFGYEKVLHKDPTTLAGASFFPYKDILFKDKAIIADKFRSKLPNEPTRLMTKARAYGLDEYVFAYLGTHEYFYARSEGLPMPAFGVFLSPSIDYTMPNVNATLYDLESKLATDYQPENITLDVTDARNLTAYEIANKYIDFFNYWVCDAYINKDYHDDEMWGSKREFHYPGSVGINEIKAIIWPVEMILNPNNERFEPKIGTIEEIEEFKKNQNDIAIYKYQWIEAQGLHRFSYASYLIIESMVDNNILISEYNFNDNFSTKFPNLN